MVNSSVLKTDSEKCDESLEDVMASALTVKWISTFYYCTKWNHNGKGIGRDQVMWVANEVWEAAVYINTITHTQVAGMIHLKLNKYFVFVWPDIPFSVSVRVLPNLRNKQRRDWNTLE